jgi:hypothetical protein
MTTTTATKTITTTTSAYPASDKIWGRFICGDLNSSALLSVQISAVRLDREGFRSLSPEGLDSMREVLKQFHSTLLALEVKTGKEQVHIPTHSRQTLTNSELRFYRLEDTAKRLAFDFHYMVLRL